MSPFKGQGANQALADGPLLAKWLSKSSVDAALTNWWRETLNRTAPVVEASRKAARDWHNPDRILGTDKEDHQEYHGFAGVRASVVPRLVEVLRERKIGPHLGGELDQSVRRVIQEHGWFEEESDNENKTENINVDHKERSLFRTQQQHSLCERVLRLARIGDTAGLRLMSLPSSSSSSSSSGGGTNPHRSCVAMVDARDENGRTCLHLAALGNHEFTCQWLLVELRILEQWQGQKCDYNDNNNSCGPADAHGKTAHDYATETGNKILARMFETVMKGR